RIDAGVLAFLVKLDGTVEIAVVGHGQGVHAEFLDACHELRNAIGAVEQAVVRVAVQMNEAIGHGSSLSRQLNILRRGTPALYQGGKRAQWRRQPRHFPFSKTTRAPTTVMTTSVLAMRSRSAGARMSRDSTTKSANLPGSSVPRFFS